MQDLEIIQTDISKPICMSSNIYQMIWWYAMGGLAHVLLIIIQQPPAESACLPIGQVG